MAISYMQLYSSGSDRKSTEEELVEWFCPDDNNEIDHNDVWEADDWTADEKNEVRSLLDKSIDRCRINSTIPTYQAPNDDYAWNCFYNQHRTNFFKDRHYLRTAFPQEFGQSSSSDATKKRKKRTLVEIGCGVGNALLPLLEEGDRDDQGRHYSWNMFGLDLSSVAIDLLKKDERFQAASQFGCAHAFVANIVDGIPDACHQVADVSSLLFCLSAIDPEQQAIAVQNVAATLQPGGTIVFRDYGRYDESQIKLGSQRSKLLKDNFYVKHDSTKCYFFTVEELKSLFESAGLKVLELFYVRRIYSNRATHMRRRRVWVQGRFQKPC